MFKNIAIVGASGAIGKAFITLLKGLYPNCNISAFSRNIENENIEGVSFYNIDYKNEKSMASAAENASKIDALDLVIVAIGTLHQADFFPEKSISELSRDKLQYLFEVNTIYPSLIAKHFIPKLAKDKEAIFAVLSARVGSISDNKLGGWYSYRASKAALNMVIKNAAIEFSRKSKKNIIIGLHPGTVDSNLSKPFQKNVPEGKLFTPEYSAEKLISVINKLSAVDTGKCFAWDGVEILP